MIKLFTRLVVLVSALFLVVFWTRGFLFARVLEGVIGAPVKISRIKVTLSEVKAYGVSVRNPKGFTEKTLASVPEIYIQYDLGSILRNRVHLKEVRLNIEEITLEKGTGGQINFFQLKAMKKSGKKEAPLQIDKVNLTLGEVRYVDSSQAEPSVQYITLGVQNTIIHNVTNPAQIVQQIVMKAIQKVSTNTLSSKVGQ